MIPDINLLPRLERGQSSSRVLYGAVAVGTILLLTLFIWQYFSARIELVNVSAQQQSLQNEVAQLQVTYDELSNETKGSIEDAVAFVERVSYPVSPLIDETQLLLPENSYLRNYEFEEKSSTITVDFETLTDVSTYINSLENSAYFADTQLEKVDNFELNPNNEEIATFNEVPRYSVDITLFMDEAYLATGGVQ
ncbi:MAG: PilN domain-containing protein [Lysinibacillus sp.]